MIVNNDPLTVCPNPATLSNWFIGSWAFDQSSVVIKTKKARMEMKLSLPIFCRCKCRICESDSWTRKMAEDIGIIALLVVGLIWVGTGLYYYCSYLLN